MSVNYDYDDDYILVICAVPNITSTSASISVATTSEIIAVSMSPIVVPGAIIGAVVVHGCCGFPGGCGSVIVHAVLIVRWRVRRSGGKTFTGQ